MNIAKTSKWEPYLPERQWVGTRAYHQSGDVGHLPTGRISAVADIIDLFDTSELAAPFRFPQSVASVTDRINERYTGQATFPIPFLSNMEMALDPERWGQATHYSVGDMLAWSYFHHSSIPEAVLPFMLRGGANPKSVLARWKLTGDINNLSTYGFAFGGPMVDGTHEVIGIIDPESFWLFMTADVPLEWLIEASNTRWSTTIQERRKRLSEMNLNS